jgi:predicted transcriptional regulator
MGELVYETFVRTFHHPGEAFFLRLRCAMVRNYRQIERIVRGFSNHRRVQILEVLDRRPDLDLMEIAVTCGIQFRNAYEHVRRLAVAGLVFKQSRGKRVNHTVSPRGRAVLAFLRKLD